MTVNNFQLRLKPSHRTVLQTCRLSLSDGEIFLFWFISLRLPVTGNNLPVFENFSDASRQNSSSQIFRHSPTCFVFCDCLFKKFPLKEAFNNHLFSDGGDFVCRKYVLCQMYFIFCHTHVLCPLRQLLLIGCRYRNKQNFAHRSKVWHLRTENLGGILSPKSSPTLDVKTA